VEVYEGDKKMIFVTTFINALDVFLDSITRTYLYLSMSVQLHSCGSEDDMSEYEPL